MASCGASGLRVRLKASIVTLVEGYVTQSDSLENHFKNDVISTVDLRSYNG